MTDGPLPDADSDFGRRVRDRLRDEQVIWLTTTQADGTPQPNPVWFVWEDPDSLIVYNRPDAKRLLHVQTRPRVSLHFNSDETGDDIAVFVGSAVRDDQSGSAARAPGLSREVRRRHGPGERQCRAVHRRVGRPPPHPHRPHPRLLTPSLVGRPSVAELVETLRFRRAQSAGDFDELNQRGISGRRSGR